jgi:hypothetical protein
MKVIERRIEFCHAARENGNLSGTKIIRRELFLRHFDLNVKFLYFAVLHLVVASISRRQTMKSGWRGRSGFQPDFW